MKNYKQNFIRHLKESGKSPNTIATYDFALRDYMEWCIEKFSSIPNALFKENIVEYIDDIKNRKNKSGKPLSPRTVNLRVNALNAFNHFLIQEDIMHIQAVPKNAFQKIQSDIVSPAKFSNKEMDRFIQTILEEYYQTGSKDSFRNYCILQLLTKTGCRISELLNISIESDIDLSGREIIIRNGKGKKTRTLLLNNKLIKVLQTYMTEIRPQYAHAVHSRYLFVSNRNSQLSRITVSKFFKKYSQASNQSKGISPHDCRHFFCSKALESGFTLAQVCNLAGHSSIQTTSLYLHPQKQEMLEKIELI